MNLRMTHWVRCSVGFFYVLSASRSLPASLKVRYGFAANAAQDSAGSVGTAYKNLPRLYSVIEV